MTLIYLTLAWAAGLLLGAQAATLPPLALATALLLCGGLGLAARRSHRLRLAFLCGAALAAGALRITIATAPPGPDALLHLNGQGWREVTGVIVAEPDVRDSHINLRLRAETAYRSGNRTPLSGRLLVQAPRYGDYAYGDRVSASGLVLTPPEFDDFSYRDYLARDRILSWMPNAEVEVLGHGHGQPLLQTLYTLKARTQDIITSALPEPQASLLVGILLGVETGIAPDVREAFNATGSSHVIAISGFNMTLIAGLVMRLLSAIWPRRARLAGGLSIAVIGVYTIFVGANAAVLRAAVMSSLLVIASLLRRRTHVPTSLAFAAGVMTLHDPFVLWDIGFQLSFCAVLGLALFADPLEHGLRRLLSTWLESATVERLLRLLSEPLIVSLAAQIATLPLIILYFGRLSLSSIAVNLLILPAQAPLIILGGLATLIGLVLPLLAQPVFWAAWLFLGWTTSVVRLFAPLPGANIAAGVDPGLVAAFYLAMLGAALLQGTRPGWHRRLRDYLQPRLMRLVVLGAGGTTAALLIIGAVALPDGRLHVHFPDSGSSNAVLVETPAGMHILIDGGQYPTRLLTALGDNLPYWDREIELLILTQPKNAQVAALPAMLERYRVQHAASTGQLSDAEDVLLLNERLTAAGIAVQAVYGGHVFETGDGVRLEVLHPAAPPAPNSQPNDAGLVLKVSYGAVSFLLMPDLSPEAEAVLVTSGRDLQATVLQLPSHGSPRVSGQALLDAVRPQVAVVQVAVGNFQGYPDDAVVARLGTVPLYQTDRHGAVTFSTDGTSLSIRTAR